VRLGRVRNDRAHHVRLPVYVRGTQARSAVEVELNYDADSLEVDGATVRRNTEAMLQYNVTRPGHVLIALASPTPLEPAKGAMLYVDFTVKDGATPEPPEVVGARVDEHPASVSDL
jgi:hypothetical protein